MKKFKTMRQSITDEHRKQMLAMHSQGKNGTQIAEILGFQPSTVNREIRKMTGRFKTPETNKANNTPDTFSMDSHDPLDYKKHGTAFCY